MKLGDYEQQRTRVAILRNRSCTLLVARGCPDRRIDQMFQCLVAARSDSAVAECERTGERNRAPSLAVWWSKCASAALRFARAWSSIT